MVLQKQMGAPATGDLTSDQFHRLAQAARAIRDGPIMIGPKIVASAKDGSWVSASGALSGDDLAHKINHTRITCLRAEGICDLQSASFDLATSFLWLELPPIPYLVKVWRSDTVVAVSEGTCGIETMTINIPKETVALATTGSCINSTPSTYALIDGSVVTMKIYQERIDRARALVYEPARRLILPPLQDASPPRSSNAGRLP